MAKYSELASRLLLDAATFYDSLSEQNEPLREQMAENANVFRQIGRMIAEDPGGKLDDVPLSELASKLLDDSARFFVALGEQNESLKDQMAENTSIFRQIAKLLKDDPMGELNSPDDEKTVAQPPKTAAAPPTAPSAVRPPNFAKKVDPADEAKARASRAGRKSGQATPRKPAAVKPAETPAVRAKKAAATPPPTFSKPANPGAGSSKATAAETANKTVGEARRYRDHRSRDPLSPLNTRIWGHRNDVQPVFGVTFPTAAVPRPVTSIWAFHRNSAVSGRANHTCHYCGARDPKYIQPVGPYDAITNCQAHAACIWCAQVMALDTVTLMKSAVLIYLPEMSQTELNRICRLIYICRISQGDAANIAKATLEALRGRRAEAGRIFGSDNPADLAERIARAESAEEYGRVLEQTKDIRLMPLDRRIVQEADLEFNQFPQILAYWRSKGGSFGGLTPPQMDMTVFRTRIESIFGPLDIPA